MWIIAHPSRIFADIVRPFSPEYPINATMLKDKFESFPENDKSKILELQDTNLLVDEIKIQSPDNPAKLLKAIHIIGKL